MKSKTTQKGFTVLELIVVIAITLMIFAVSGSVYSVSIQNSNLTASSRELISTLRTAQMRSISGFHNSSWGVHLSDTSVPGEKDSFTIWIGADYATRDTSWDIETDLPPNLTYSSVSLNGAGADIIFDKTSGQTQQYGTVQIQNNQNETQTIYVNPMGQIEIN